MAYVPRIYWSKKSFHIKRLFVLKHKVYSPAEFMGKNPQRFTLVVFAFQFTYIIFSIRRIPEHKDGGFFDRPFEMVVTDQGTGYLCGFSKFSLSNSLSWFIQVGCCKSASP
jgi:hypothetical protein